MSKAVKLTPAENEIIVKFIGNAVLSNETFPSRTLGQNKLTVQELVNFSIPSLENYGEFIEKSANQNGSSFKSKKGPVKFGNVLATDLITFLHLTIQFKEYEAYVRKLKNELEDTNQFLADAESPEEKRAKALEKKNQLLKELEVA